MIKTYVCRKALLNFDMICDILISTKLSTLAENIFCFRSSKRLLVSLMLTRYAVYLIFCRAALLISFVFFIILHMLKKIFKLLGIMNDGSFRN